ncbi:MAG TPA: ATP-binding cassette domain-containing protein [Mycobacteriales bacterium]|nr:ATP-binding cassette domain-containing protein [Mycobacteriales bacterium]
MTSPNAGQPVIRAVQLGRAYGGDVHALRDATVTVPRGDWVAITGASGSGKSTLLNLLGLLDRPTSGRYELDGEDVGTLPESERTARRALKLGFVFQACHLVPHLTVEENVTLGLRYARVHLADWPERTAEALRTVGLQHRAHAWPKTLSGGEQQRAAIARAIATRPPVLLCDEPTGNLDTDNTTRVLDLLQQLNDADQTIVMITHEADVAARARRRLKMRDGRLEPSGGEAA